jgi:hypothetical protein
MGMALDRIIADVHAQFGTLLLSDPKYNSKTVQGAHTHTHTHHHRTHTTAHARINRTRTGHDSDGWFPCGGAELVGKDKAGQLAVAPLALSCLRRALPSEMPLHELVHTLAKYTLHVDNGTQPPHRHAHGHTAHALAHERA